MPSLFDTSDRNALVARLSELEARSSRHWGKMTPAQMLRHCSIALETATGVRSAKQSLLGKLVTPFIRSMILGEKPFRRNAPTDPTFVVSEEADFIVEKKRLRGLVDRFCQAGPAEAGKQTHPFFGKLTGDEWGRLTFKHLDHHLRQFGV